jgi:hypothetical protein
VLTRLVGLTVALLGADMLPFAYASLINGAIEVPAKYFGKGTPAYAATESDDAFVFFATIAFMSISGTVFLIGGLILLARGDKTRS